VLKFQLREEREVAMSRKFKREFKSFLPYLTPLIAVVVLFLLGFKVVIVLTDSMEPAVPRGSLSVTAPTWIVKPSCGDIILYKVRFEKGEWLIMHRIVNASGSTYYTKGDNRGFRDPWVVSEENIEGVHVFSVPMVGYLFLLLKVFIILMVVFALAYWVLSMLFIKATSMCASIRVNYFPAVVLVLIIALLIILYVLIVF